MDKIEKVKLCGYCDGANPDCDYYDSKNHYVVKPAKLMTTNNPLEELISSWAEFLKFCSKQQIKNRKFQIKLNKQYDKDRKKLPDFVQFRADNNPPQFQSIYDNPSFETFIQWLTEERSATSAKLQSRGERKV